MWYLIYSFVFIDKKFSLSIPRVLNFQSININEYVAATFSKVTRVFYFYRNERSVLIQRFDKLLLKDMKLLDFTGRKVDPSLLMGFKENKKEEDPNIKVSS